MTHAYEEDHETREELRAANASLNLRYCADCGLMTPEADLDDEGRCLGCRGKDRCSVCGKAFLTKELFTTEFPSDLVCKVCLEKELEPNKQPHLPFEASTAKEAT